MSGFRYFQFSLKVGASLQGLNWLEEGTKVSSWEEEVVSFGFSDEELSAFTDEEEFPAFTEEELFPVDPFFTDDELLSLPLSSPWIVLMESPLLIMSTSSAASISVEPESFWSVSFGTVASAGSDGSFFDALVEESPPQAARMNRAQVPAKSAIFFMLLLFRINYSP